MNVSQDLMLIENSSISKQGIKTIAKNLSTPVLEGEKDSLETFIKLDVIEKVAKEAKSNIINETLSETDNYNLNERNCLGVDFTTSTRKPTRDFSAHSEISGLENQIKELTQKKKNLEKIVNLQCENDKPILVESTGELLSKEDFPLKSMGTTSIVLKYPQAV